MMRMPCSKMNIFRPLMLVLCCGISFLAISNLPAFAADQRNTPAGQQSAQAQGAGSGSTIRLNFIDADINVVIQFISELTQKNFIVDNNVRGKVTIISPEMIPVDEAYRYFESVLEMYGFATVPSGKFIKIVPSTEARAKSIETRLPSEDIPKQKDPEDTLITQLIPLTYADANQVKMLFTPLISKTSIMMAYPDTNTLIVTDASSNIKRLQHILSVIDVPGIGKEVSVVPLEFANADKLAKQLSSIYRIPGAAQKGAVQKTLQFVADERTNTIIFLASEEDAVRIKKTIRLLDKSTPKGKGNIRIYYLEHATAEDTAKVLQDLSKGKTTTEGGKEAPIFSDPINITFDKATNSLIIMANSEDYLVLEDVIRKLDIPRNMVHIEALIMEVNMDKGFELGVELSAFDDTEIGGNEGVVGGSFSGSNGINPTELASSTGLALGFLTGGVELTTTQLGTIIVPNLGALIKAVETEKDVHILSKPSLMTTDNEEATIVVGKNVPYQTKISTSSTGNETFNSYEYKNVGLTLKITPHISEDRLVRLKISQELTALTDASGTVSSTPTTLNRSVETTVIVKDQEMLVIGGLIDDNITNTVTRVPILGRIPLLGRLFRYNSNTGNKTNLYIFITPKVIQNPVEARQLLDDTKTQMTPVENGLVKLYGPVSADDDDLDSNADPSPESDGSEQ